MKERNSVTRAMAQRSGGGAHADRPEQYKGGGTCTACTEDKCQCDVDAMLAAPRTVPCPMCRCENAPIGTLGLGEHFRCRYCGMAYSTNEQGWIA